MASKSCADDAEVCVFVLKSLGMNRFNCMITRDLMYFVGIDASIYLVKD